VDELNAAYDADGSAFRIEHVATGFQLLTRPQYALWLEKIHQRRARLRLSPPALETLAIVAYRQPLTRADVEAVRGVQSGEMLKLLMERDLVRIVGEHDSLGRPYLYGTTRQFLELFGLHSLAELPQAEGLAPPAPAEETESDASGEEAVAA
jgi:segregation and condensation protein B